MTRESVWLSDIVAGGQRRTAATEALFHAYASRFRQYFLRRGASAADAEELGQETFIKILRSAENAGPIDQPRAWLWSVASSVLIDFLRRKTSEMSRIDDSVAVDGSGQLITALDHEGGTKQYSDATADSATRSSSGDVAHRIGLEQCVERQFRDYTRQNPDGAQVLLWASVDQMTAPEIGQLIGRTPDATRQLLTQLRRRVREFLAVCREYL